MAEIRNNRLYIEDIRTAAEADMPWDGLYKRTVLLSGATGLIGTFLVDVLMYRNRMYDADISVIAVGRDKSKAKRRFDEHFDNPLFSFYEADINRDFDIPRRADYVIHAASNTHPLQYSNDPVGTILTNVTGTKNVLDYAKESGAKRTVFLSSVEIYGENRGDVERFDEGYLGYIDCNTLRAGYPEGKRAGEALCQAYRKQYGLDIVIPRLSRTYGPTMTEGDSKAVAQFIKKGVAGENIVLKSKGDQLYSYSYVADAVSGILCVMLSGEDGEAYNISDEASDVTLKELSDMIARYVGSEVIFELPDETESAGYSKATKALLYSGKLKTLGWKATYTMEDGIRRTIEILKGR